MQKLVVDTNVYIDYFNDGQHEDILTQPRTVKYMSTVVLMELLAGVSSPQERRLLLDLEADFRKKRRILTPSCLLYTSPSPRDS